MANHIETLVATAPITCSADKFYNFFKFSISELVKVFPAAFTGAQVLEGEEGVAGCVTLWSYSVGGIAVSAKVTTEAIDDGAKTITFNVTEGDLLTLYKSFKVTLAISEGSAKWTFAFEKSSFLIPPPLLYVPLGITIITIVDAYLLIN